MDNGTSLCLAVHHDDRFWMTLVPPTLQVVRQRKAGDGGPDFHISPPSEVNGDPEPLME